MLPDDLGRGLNQWPPRRLSQRELSVINQIATGNSLKVVAYSLSISIQAVSTYLQRARMKLALSSGAALNEAVFGRRASTGEIRRALSGRLSSAELSVVEGVLLGRSNAGIAQLRGTSTRTVENQMSRILQKLSVGSRAELVAYLYSTGPCGFFASP